MITFIKLRRLHDIPFRKMYIDNITFLKSKEIHNGSRQNKVVTLFSILPGHYI